MNKRQILVDHRIDWYDWGSRVGDQVPVTPEVHGRIHKGEHVGEGATVLNGDLVPGRLEPSNDYVVKPGDNRELRVEVLGLFVAVLGNMRHFTLRISSGK